MNNSANVISECSISVADLNFGNIGLLNADKTASAAGSVFCNDAVAYSIKMYDAGDANKTDFEMVNGANAIGFQLHQDAARTLLWDKDNAKAGSMLLADVGTNKAFTVYGRIPAQTSQPAGAYAASMRAQIDF